MLDNPFKKRAVEYFGTEDALLAVISPLPLLTHLKTAAQDDSLYDRLVWMRGAPGTGKTTLAQLFEYHRVAWLCAQRSHQLYKETFAALVDCRVILDDKPTILGCRLALESSYREVWQYPYPQPLRARLTHALIEARAILAWCRNLERARVDLGAARVTPLDGNAAALEAIGGTDLRAVQARARDMERELYGYAAALVPPPIETLESSRLGEYRPLNVIDRIEIFEDRSSAVPTQRLRPLLILDDAQMLHPEQLRATRAWLTRREPRIARWLLTWPDAMMSVRDLVDSTPTSEPEQPGAFSGRAITAIWLQGGDGARESRNAQRRDFRRVASDIADRYLAKTPGLRERGYTDFNALLATDSSSTRSPRTEIVRFVDREQRRFKVPQARREVFEHVVREYSQSARTPVVDDVQLMMVRILMAREHGERIRRNPLFEGLALPFDDSDANRGSPEVGEELEGGAVDGGDVTTNGRERRVDASIADAARLQLLHEFRRPYYFGFETLCDAATENTEHFLQLAGALVDRSLTHIMRGRDAFLTPDAQHVELQRSAVAAFEAWSFPEHAAVRHLARAVASECVEWTRRANAPLAPGPNAFGIRQSEFELLPKRYPGLAKILLYGSAYNALTIVREYRCKKELWCLIELGGVGAVAHGLSLGRGSFLERSVVYLKQILEQFEAGADVRDSALTAMPPATRDAAPGAASPDA